MAKIDGIVNLTSVKGGTTTYSKVAAPEIIFTALSELVGNSSRTSLAERAYYIHSTMGL